MMRIDKCEVLVIGSGGAGLRCAIELKDKGVDVLVVGKCKKKDAHTILATGGINAALRNMDKGDSWQMHVADTIRDGGGINDSKAVEVLCKNASYAVKELEEWGANFHKEENGKISQRFFGAATYRRACFVGDQTGKAILNSLVEQTLKRKIRFKSEVYIFSLLKGNNGRVNGAIGIEVRTGDIVVFHCKVVVLCTGGHSRMFKRSSSRFWENNGDGIRLAADVGARFMDMEMFQFHPTGMVFPKKVEGVLVTEAVRGEGGILTNSKGERFMEKYDSERKELSARDIVARAIYREIVKGGGTRHGGVLLDISNKKKSYILKRLPKMYKQFKEFAGIDISKEKMEVAPTAHYSMGGILVNHKTGGTDVPGLFAIGEVTSGIHGGNRLGGNSLAEIIVFGRLTGRSVVKEIKRLKETELDEKQIRYNVEMFMSRVDNSGKGRDPIKAKREIQEIMWKAAGVVRDKKSLDIGLKRMKKYRKMKFNVGKKTKMNEKLIAALDVNNMVPTCEMILFSALMRKESRAAHYRSDYSEMKKTWKKNIICRVGKNEKIVLSIRKVPKVSKEINKLMIKKYEPKDLHEKHMLE